MNFDFQVIGLSNFRIGTTFHFETRLTAHKKHQVIYRTVIKKFHSYLSRLQSSGDYQDGDIANMDQTSLLFVLNDGKNFDIKDVKEV